MRAGPASPRPHTVARTGRTLTETLAWAGDGAAHLRGLMTRMADDAYPAPSALPGWTRAHLLSHVARNADAMVNLLTWARTGVPTPAHPSAAQRDADIDAGAARPAAVIRADVLDSSDRLADAVRATPDKAWAAHVQNVQGVTIPATDIPWSRAREMWIHAVDLDAGAAFTDLPTPMLGELITDVARTVGAAPDCPPLRLVASDQDRAWTVGVDGRDSGVLDRVTDGAHDGARDGAHDGDLDGVEDVRGPAAALAAWLLGRSKGRDLRTGAGVRPPALPRWL